MHDPSEDASGLVEKRSGPPRQRSVGFPQRCVHAVGAGAPRSSTGSCCPRLSASRAWACIRLVAEWVGAAATGPLDHMQRIAGA